ncbi:ABC transporter ATP-binding protein [Actinocorallia lasiicapitis]
MSERLPVATKEDVRAYARRLILRHPCDLAVAVGLHGLAAITGLVTPFLFSRLVENPGRHIDLIAGGIALFVTVQAVLTRQAFFASAKLGEKALAELREEFIDQVLRLPLSTVERAGTGDLLARTTRDVDQLSGSVRHAAPEVLIALVTCAFTVIALGLTSPLLLLPVLLVAPILLAATRWYLNRARSAYLREHAAWAEMTDGLAETVTGARTVTALRRETSRHERTDHDIARSWAAERYSLGLRMRWYPALEIGYIIPVVLTLLLGGLFYLDGRLTLGQVTAGTLYMQQLGRPLDMLLNQLDELQLGGASLARLLGVADVPADRSPTGASPDGIEISAKDVKYAYAQRDVLHGISLDLAPGERLAIVGPSGAGKSTLGRLIAGIHAPREGSVTLGNVPLTDLPLDELRHQIALVTQEHHVFRGTLRDNLALVKPASDDDLRASLAAVAWSGPDLDEKVGSGGTVLTPAQAQQLALARLILADPHTLVLDEATSLIDPRAARDLERTLAAVLEGRTVIAIAHRLHTAHDADRVAVVEDGVISELGTHDQLVARSGSYASLWSTWHST